MLSVKIMSLDWVEQFAAKLKDAGLLIADVVIVCHTLLKLMSFAQGLQEDDGVESDHLSRMQLYIDVPSNSEDEDGENVVHSLRIEGTYVPVTLVLQLLHLMTEGFTRTVQNIEKDSTELQELLGAVSAFRQELKLPVDLPPFCPHKKDPSAAN